MIKKFLSSELGKGTFILFITMNIFNILNFLFHFAMGKMLGPEGYGVLAVLMSILYIFSIPSEAMQNLVSRYTSKFNIKKENSKIKYLLFKSLKRGIKFSFFVLLVLTAFSFWFSKFVNINFWLLFLTNSTIFAYFSWPSILGVLQGRKKFLALGNNLIITSGLKLFFAISFVLFGFKVGGAMLGVWLSLFAGIVFGMYSNKEIIKEKEEEADFGEFYKSGIPYFIIMLVIFVAFSMDIIFARRFFSPELAGKYSVLSMIGKMIFFGTQAIGKAMFPLTSEKHETNQDTFAILKKSFLVISLICIISILGCFALSKLIVLILYGHQYIDVSGYLVYSAIALSFLSLANLLAVYGLSTNKIKTKKDLVLLIISGLFLLGIEAVLLYFFHNSLKEYILAFMVSNIAIFIGSVFLIKRHEK